MPEPEFHVQIYRKRPLIGRQSWRWRAVEGPRPGTLFERKLANGGEPYVNKQDMLETVWKLFGEHVRIDEVTK
jgi:hypothetical protein